MFSWHCKPLDQRSYRGHCRTLEVRIRVRCRTDLRDHERPSPTGVGGQAFFTRSHTETGAGAVGKRQGDGSPTKTTRSP